MPAHQHRAQLATRARLIVLCLVALAALAACSGGSGQSSTSDTAAGSSGSLAEKDQVSSASAPSSGRPRAAVRTKAVVRTGEVAVTSHHLTQVRAHVDDLLAKVGGTIDREDTTDDRYGKVEHSTLRLRVPVASFDTVRTALGRLGKREYASETAKDVTTQLIDASERIRTLQTSLDRLHRFQRSAQDVGDLLRYEDQITSRTSELQSLKGQRDYLADQTSMSTITLQLSTPERYVEPRGALDDAGFVTGVRAGWHALMAFVVVAVTVLGAVLPFLVMIVLVGGPLWVLVRAMARRGVISSPTRREKA